MAKRKVRKFADGGFTAEQEKWLGGADRTDPYILARMRSAVPDAKEEYVTETGKNPRIDDETRARAMKFVEDGSNGSPVTKSITSTKVSVTKPKESSPAPTETPRKPETAEENKARMEALTKKQALINVAPEDYVTPGGVLKGMLKSVIGNAAKNKLKTYTAEEMARMSPRIGSEALKLTREAPKLGMKKGGSVKKMSSGGKVKSASSRADGCAIRGKTRA